METSQAVTTRSDFSSPGGTGARLGHIVIIVSGVAALASTLLTFVSVWLQTKNYRKPLLQRYVIRILLMVPIYSASSWASLVSIKTAFWIEPFRDVYEAFTIYTFFQLLINFIGGERALIVLMTGRRPVAHLWPLNYCLPKVDISDPHTFLAIKRGILQYAWAKPVLSIATIVMKATGTYQEGYFGLSSGYMWSSIIYNVSISVSLYALAMFWICMSDDLQPFRPMPKFLCVKGIIFASYWQGLFLSGLVWLGAIPDGVPGYTPDNLAAAIQDALICMEMPLFAIAHWYAFSWHDYADASISSARMPVKYALRDAFGPRDLIEDTKDTFTRGHYEYRYFDAQDNVLAHEDSTSRTARMMEGMRYERGGKGKYWIPKPAHDSTTPLLSKVAPSSARTMSPGPHRALDAGKYGTTSDDGDEDGPNLNPEDERLYTNARALEFGDWNYPVITAHTVDPESRGRAASPGLITAATNRNYLQPTRINKERRKSKIKEIQDSVGKGKHRGSHDQGEASRTLLRQSSSTSASSAKSDQSQLVDLVVEDHEAEEVERVRARKEGGPGWNEVETKHFVRTYPASDEEEEVREGFNPDTPQTRDKKHPHTLDSPLASDEEGDEVPEDTHWERRDYEAEEGTDANKTPQYGSFREEQNAWGSGSSAR